VESSCEFGIEPSGAIKCWETNLDLASYYLIFLLGIMCSSRHIIFISCTQNFAFPGQRYLFPSYLITPQSLFWAPANVHHCGSTFCSKRNISSLLDIKFQHLRLNRVSSSLLSPKTFPHMLIMLRFKSLLG
jgi:hypothetical protein